MNLQLSLKKQWFEMTKAGIKTEDYREINEYWLKRLFKKLTKYPLSEEEICSYLELLKNGIFKNTSEFWAFSGFNSKQFEYNIMTLGYPKSIDTERILKYEHKGIEIRTGNPEWGAEPNKLYFVIKHGETIN